MPMTVAPDLVATIVRRMFGTDALERVLVALQACSATAPATEAGRVQLAVLKLYDEDPGRNLATWTSAAKTDYRDVL